MTDSNGREDPPGNEDHTVASQPNGFWPDEVMTRPGVEILGDASLIGQAESTQPAPSPFTHELTNAVSYRPGAEERTSTIPAGTPVVLIHVEGDRCWVVDGAGRQVSVNATSLRKLPETGPA